MALNDETITGKKNSQYKKINKEEFEECLESTKLDFEIVDYKWTGELIYEAYSEEGTYAIRVYSSLDKTTGKARDKGADAIRVVLIHVPSGQPLMKNKRVHRIQTFCKNLRQRIHKIVDSKGRIKYCPVCDSIMVVRENKKNKNKFYGCSQWPDCSGTRPIDS